jgi:acetyl esterase/lipase
MRFPPVLRRVLWTFAAVLVLGGVAVGGAWWYYHPPVERTNNVVYGKRRGHDLAIDVLRPRKPNGLGVAVLVSGGWKSGKPGSFQPWMAAPLLRRGYTLFAVYHVSQPEATVMEIIEDMNRAIRFIRYSASRFQVNPAKLGVCGGSAGGHLSLMLATRGGPGAAQSSDPVESESSAVQAVAIFYPVTDLLNLGASTENEGADKPPKSFKAAFGEQSTNPPVWRVIGRDCSPIYFVSSNLPPTLIYHGDADTLVPLDQSQRFEREALRMGNMLKLVVHPGGKHGWLTMLWDVRAFADWFDKYLGS